MSLKMEDTVKNRTYPKRPVVSETGSYRYKYCNDIHSGRIDHFDRDRWLSLQCSRILFKCILILLFPDGAKDVF